MNKSKFLKKSLAMLLALMLVVAMIPLSASAAAPVLREASANGYALTVDNSAHTITGSIAKNDQEVDLKVLVQAPIDNTEVWYYDVTTEADTTTKATPDTPYTGIWEIKGLKVTDYLNDNGQVEVKLQTRNTKSNEKQDYTVTLDRSSNTTDTSITKLVLWDMDQDLSQLGYSTASKDDATIEVTMPHTNYAPPKYVVDELVLPEGATATYTSADGTTQQNVKINTDAESGSATRVENGGTITVSNGGFRTNYTLKITSASGFETFTFEEALDTVVFSDANAIAVLLPYGYTSTANDDDEISVTPVFDVDYDSVSVSWNSTTLTSGESSISVDKDDQVKTNLFQTFKGTDNNSWEGRKANADGVWGGNGVNGSFAEGVISGFTKPVEITVDYTEASDKTYKVYFFEPAYNNEAEIKEVTIGSETATIEGTQINITLPAGSDASKIGSKGLELNVVASDEANITVPMQSSVNFVDQEGTPSRKLEENFKLDAGDTLSATSPVTIRIEADDEAYTAGGDTVGETVDYTLNVKVADTYEEAAITGLYLRAPGAEDPIEPDTSKTVDGKKAFIFTVPYSVYDKTDLEGYKLFYTKTVGATMTYGTGTTMPKSGVELTGTDPFVPKPGVASTDPDYKVAYTVTSVNPANDSNNSTTYYVVIKRAEPSNESDLVEFALTGTRDYNDLTDDLIFDATIDKEADDSWTVDAQIPWSHYQEWSKIATTEFGGQATVSDKAKAYVKVGNTLFPFNAVRKGDGDGTGDFYAADPTGFTYSRVMTSKNVSIVVLSERVWVNMENINKAYYTSNRFYDFTNHLAGVTSNANGYTVYNLTATQKPAETTIEPITMTLVDGTGWTANLKVDVAGDEISGSIPYALTSDVNDNGAITGKVNPVYIDYSVADRAWVLGVDKGHEDEDTPVLDPTTEIPTSDGGKAVFDDYSKYTGRTDKYDGAYLLISRSGKVFVYYNNNKVATPTNTAANMIAVSSEAGTDNYAQLTFDLSVNEPNDEAEFKSFGFKGINSTATIDQDADTITVTLPYGTEYTFLTPVYTTSDGAEVYVQDTDKVNGDDGVGARGWIKSGESTINFSTSRRFRVEAENESDYTTYTVNVKVSDQFTDVNPGDWFYDNVMNAVANGYMSGLGDGTFGPMKTATRAQFATALACAMGYEAPEDPSTIETPFIDVDANDWYAGAVNFCYDEGIISGYEDTTFRPDQTITRQEAAAMLNNAFGLEASTDVSQFTDAGRIASWATAHVGAVANAELMNGDVAGTFRPTGTLTRAELASILMNANIHGFID